MSDLYWLTDEHMARLRPFFPKSRGKPRVEDRKVLSGIIFINRDGLHWRDAPATYGPPKTLYNRWVRWSRMGVFARMLIELAGEGAQTETVIMDATHLKAHRTASSLARKRGAKPVHWAHQGRAELEAARAGRRAGAITFFLTAGQTSDYIGARVLLGFLPKAEALLADRGYDADWFRKALIECAFLHFIPGRKARKVPIVYDTDLYKERRRIENMFGRLKDWRRIATRYDRCADLFLSACCLGAVVLYWL